MKTAEQIVEKLWEKYSAYSGHYGFRIVAYNEFTQALHEYGAAARPRAAGVVEEVTLEWAKSPPLTVSEPTAAVYRDAIERMELP